MLADPTSAQSHTALESARKTSLAFLLPTNALSLARQTVCLRPSPLVRLAQLFAGCWPRRLSFFGRQNSSLIAPVCDTVCQSLTDGAPASLFLFISIQFVRSLFVSQLAGLAHRSLARARSGWLDSSHSVCPAFLPLLLICSLLTTSHLPSPHPSSRNSRDACSIRRHCHRQPRPIGRRPCGMYFLSPFFRQQSRM